MTDFILMPRTWPEEDICYMGSICLDDLLMGCLSCLVINVETVGGCFPAVSAEICGCVGVVRWL